MKKRSFATMLSLFTAFMATSLLCNQMNSVVANAITDCDAIPLTVQVRSGGSNFNYLVVMDDTIAATDSAIGIRNARFHT